jgi:hypothetical protein|tara:strand:+ start:1645 stop:1812 length:168 start_codon:yes stop_codon:yes gene_type:complete
LAGKLGLPIFYGVLQLNLEQLSELLASYDALQLSGIVLEFNAGERLSEEKINRSL